MSFGANCSSHSQSVNTETQRAIFTSRGGHQGLCFYSSAFSCGVCLLWWESHRVPHSSSCVCFAKANSLLLPHTLSGSLSPTGVHSAQASIHVQWYSCICLSFLPLQHSVEETAAECKRLGATVQAFVVDCSKREDIYSAAEKVGEQGHFQRLTHRASSSERLRNQEKRRGMQFMTAPGICPLLADFSTESKLAFPRWQPLSSSSVRLWHITCHCRFAL